MLRMIVERRRLLLKLHKEKLLTADRTVDVTKTTTITETGIEIAIIHNIDKIINVKEAVVAITTDTMTDAEMTNMATEIVIVIGHVIITTIRPLILVVENPNIDVVLKVIAYLAHLVIAMQSPLIS